MSHKFEKRVERLEEALVIGDKRKELERRCRSHYNIRNVSDAALYASIEALLKRHSLPDWAEAEFQRPIPRNAYANAVREVEESWRTLPCIAFTSCQLAPVTLC